jgi:hypothetical protein
MQAVQRVLLAQAGNVELGVHRSSLAWVDSCDTQGLAQRSQRTQR